jgi:signal transduction histidine kinase
LTIKLDEKSDVGVFIFGDTRLVPLVVEALIQNAIDYGRENSTADILLKKGDDGNCQFSVSNEGIGIEEENRDKMFTQFYRTDKALRTETDKSGLSLFVANLIMKKHGGRMWFESAAGKTTTFFAEFPMAKEKKEAEKV